MRAREALLGTAVALVARSAAAEPLNLEWRAPEGCPSATEVRDAALRAAPRPAADPLDADVRVEHGERWTVTIQTRRAGLASTERRLDASSCAALADATAVILALALLPPEAAPEPPPRPAPVPSPAPAPTAEPAAAAAPPAPDRTPAAAPLGSHDVAAGASFTTDATTLPSAAAGARGHVAWTPSRARIELDGGYFASQSKTAGTSAAGATFTLVTVGARGCWAVARTAIELSPCAGADLQMVHASGYGAAQNYDAHAHWVSAAGGALLRVAVTSWLALRADGDALVPLSRPRFVVEGDGAVHRPASIGARGAIGAEILFL